jgi:hypothetical protein
LFPPIEENFHSNEARIPIVVDVCHMDEKNVSNGDYLHTPGTDKPIDVYDYAVTDTSDELDYFPRRGRSPPARFRQEPLPAEIPLPISTPGSDYLEETPRAIKITDPFNLASAKNEDDPQHIPLQTNMEKQTISVPEEPRNTAAATVENSTAYPLTGVGTHSTQFEIPPSANLDDDLTNDMHNDKLVLENEAVG